MSEINEAHYSVNELIEDLKSKNINFEELSTEKIEDYVKKIEKACLIEDKNPLEYYEFLKLKEVLIFRG